MRTMAGLNLGSLLLGLTAWILPMIYLAKAKNLGYTKSFILSALSISACAISLFLQILNVNYLIEVGDWTALMDTGGAIVFASAVLLVGTLTLNAICFIMYHDRVKKR
ncbi:hypothetical protein ACS127_13155 [Amphibacillus sp. Q70]|uniref:hypothetical protein n=1 Tax=Amphibacillus sp. Q70 TaxID=3453416 RepID=UPI003F825FAA